MSVSVIQRAFAGGELAPALHVRADQAKYQTGLRTCRNFIVQRHGGVANRPGTRYVGACKTTASSVMLLRYVSEVAGQSLLLELGNGYIRFFQNGAAVQVNPALIDAWDIAINYVAGDLVKQGGIVYYALVANVGVAPPAALTWYPFAGNAYELPSPFGLNLPNWVQSGRTITLTHKDAPPVDLVFVALTRWLLRPVTTANTVAVPTGLALVTPGAGTRRYGYVVTAAAAGTYEESVASSQMLAINAADVTPLAPNVLTWTAVAGAPEYYVYSDPYGNGTYGFIGTATGSTTFRDPGLVPDFALTPPLERLLFNALNGYPNVCAYYQQRRWFAYSNTDPDSVWGSRTGFVSNFGISSPLQDDDALTFRIAGNNHNPVRHLLALKTGLIVLTDAGEWTVTSGQQGQALIPNAIDAQQQTYVGAAGILPVIVGNSILYVQARGSIVCDLRFDVQVEGLGGRDLSIFAAHLFEGFALTDMDYAQTVNSIVWAVRSDGTLLGLTYLREQDIWGWHRHDTGAADAFEHVCVVPEALEDTVYVIVRRTIGGVTKRYIERLARRFIGPTTFDADAFFVDCGLTYAGVPVNTVSGLTHLEGKVVAVVADGSVVFDGDPTATTAAAFTVTAGVINLGNVVGVTPATPLLASTIHVGLPIRYADVELLDLDVQGQSVRDKKKRVGSITLLLEKSARTFRAGPDTAHLVRYALKPSEVAADSYTGPAELNLTASFNDNGRVFIRHTDPLPLTILGVVPNLELGG